MQRQFVLDEVEIYPREGTETQTEKKERLITG